MLRYKNKYRVVCHFDVEDLTPIKEDIFIYCSGEGEGKKGLGMESNH